MSKILILVAALMIGGSALVWIYEKHPVMLKVVTGSARVLTSQVAAEIRIDGQPQSSARCFHMSSYFDGRGADNIVLWLPHPSAIDGRAIFIIDQLNHNVGIPNSSVLQYHLLWNRFLFQAQSGSLMVPLQSAKSYSQSPELLVSDHAISFRVPDDASDFGGRRIELAF